MLGYDSGAINSRGWGETRMSVDAEGNVDWSLLRHNVGRQASCEVCGTWVVVREGYDIVQQERLQLFAISYVSALVGHTSSIVVTYLDRLADFAADQTRWRGNKRCRSNVLLDTELGDVIGRRVRNSSHQW